MSELKTNKISTNDQNNVAIDNALGLKSYTTTARDALTSVAGDMIYNTTDSKVQVYNGSAWNDLGGVDVVQVEYVVAAGGGGGGNGNTRGGGGGGAGGYRTNHSTDTSGGSSSTEASLYMPKSFDIPISIGGGGAGENDNYGGYSGTQTYFGGIASFGGGGGTGRGATQNERTPLGGSAGGWSGGTATDGRGGGYSGMVNQGSESGGGNSSNYRAGGGGGANQAGKFCDDGLGAAGGNGCISTLITTTQATAQSVGEISGSDVYFAGGGAGRGNLGITNGTGGLGGGGAVNNNNGTANTSGGGGAGNNLTAVTGAGGSGVVIFRVADTVTVSGFTCLTYATQTTGGYKYYFITQGTGTISFS